MIWDTEFFKYFPESSFHLSCFHCSMKRVFYLFFYTGRYTDINCILCYSYTIISNRIAFKFSFKDWLPVMCTGFCSAWAANHGLAKNIMKAQWSTKKFIVYIVYNVNTQKWKSLQIMCIFIFFIVLFRGSPEHKKIVYLKISKLKNN